MKKVIWITGASSGIGKSLAKAYAANGNTLILSARNIDALQKVASEIQQYNCNPYCLPMDVGAEASIPALVDSVITEHGNIDILINNAGISQRSLASETDVEVGKKIMNINFFGAVNLTKAVLPYMLKAEKGHIVVVSSAAGKFGFPGRSYYSASKHALHGFFDSLSLELHQTKINVLLVCPGRISTNISKNALTGDGNSYNVDDHRLKNGISPDKAAEKIKKAIERGSKEIYFGGQEVLLIYIKRLFPALYRFIAARVKA